MGDAEALAKLISGLEALAPTRPVVEEVVLPLTRGVEAFGAGGYEEAIRWLEPLDGQLVRVGGSHAQWEVFEDTLLQAYLRASQFERAEALLRRRLARARRPATWSGWSRPPRQNQRRAAIAPCRVAAGPTPTIGAPARRPGRPRVHRLHRLRPAVTRD